MFDKHRKKKHSVNLNSSVGPPTQKDTHMAFNFDMNDSQQRLYTVKPTLISDGSPVVLDAISYTVDKGDVKIVSVDNTSAQIVSGTAGPQQITVRGFLAGVQVATDVGTGTVVATPVPPTDTVNMNAVVGDAAPKGLTVKRR